MVDFAEPQAQATLFGVALTGMWFAVFASLLVLRSGVLRHLASRMRRASYPSRIVAAALFAAAVAVGGSKPGGSQPTRSLSPAPSVDSLTEADIARGFVLSRVGTDEVHSFDPPPGATVCERWQRTGSATGWTPVATNAADWAFPVGTNLVSAFRVFAFGRIDPFVPAGDALVSTDNWFSPFEATLGIVPAANWPLLPETAVPSRFWHRFTPSNTLLLTWQNALLDRSTNAPVSFQAELRPSGAFVFRYDLCDSAALREMKLGASFDGHAWTTSTIPAAVTSLSFVPVSCADLENPDRDGDGISTADEIFRYGTDPDLPDTDLDGIPDGAEIPLGPNPLTRDTDSDGLVDGSDPDPLAATPLSDLDCDSIPDAYEQFWFGGTNAVDDADARDGTGFTLRLKLAAGFDPTAAPSTAATAFTNQIVSWKLWDGFALDGDALAAAGTNLVFERSFAINRTSAWQQFFLSSSPTSAAPWEIHGGALEWEDSSGASGAFLRSPFTDSVRLPLAGDAVESLTLRLRATGETPFASPRPVYLVAWAPHIEVQTGQTIQLASGRLVSILTDGSASAAEVVIDRSHRPCRAPLSAEETDLSVLEGIADETNGEVWYSGDINGGAFHTYRPGVFSIPDLRPETPSPPLLRTGAKSGGAGAGHDVLSLSPRVWFGGSRCYVGGVSYDWRGGAYGIDSGYPLDTPCLRRGWEQDAAGGIACTCTYGVDAGIGPSAPDYLETSCSVDGSVCTGEIRVGGVLVWSETATHCHDENCEYGDISRLDECGGCQDGCANGNCDAIEGASLGSLKFRIPLGTPRKGQVSGFAWFEADDPVAITPSLFSVLARSDSTVSDTWSGASRRIVCSDARGRDLTVAPVENGVRVTIRTTATQALEHTWDIVNAGGSTSRIRLVKTSRLGNTMEDWTFTRDDYGVWTRLDNIARLSETLESYDGMPYGGGKVEWRTIRDADGAFLGETATYSTIVGECDNAVMRETYFAENTGSATHWRSASWWNDPKTQRHGKLRLLESNDRPWEYHDYDAQGRETLRIEQRCGAPVPAFAFGQDLTASQGFPASPEASSISNAFVTVFGCETLPGDTQSPDDFLKPRLEERYVVENGVATLVSRSWHRHTRDSSQSIPVEKHETWRAASQTSAFGDPANAYSYSVTLDENAAGVPLVARGRAVESLDEDGVLSETTVAQSSGRVVFETRKSFSGVSFPTYDVEELDATHGTVLRRETRLAATGTVIAGEQNLYDDKNRLRSTSYLDGTLSTNAYSCCRLLWSRDREGRTTLRSAETGTDHLYYALEDVWMKDLPQEPFNLTNLQPFNAPTGGAFRVTQHFFDALGRETNTVTRTSTTPGGASRPGEPQGGGGFQSAVSISYPDGGSDYAIRTDGRGAVTTTSLALPDNRTIRTEILTTNGVEVLRTTTTAILGGPTTIRREWDDVATALPPSLVGRFVETPLPENAASGRDAPTARPQWTAQTTYTSYLPDGHRVETTVTTASDHPAVTNSVATYDLLGRLLSTATPGANGAWIVTSNAYDAATSRLLASTTTGSPPTTYGYNSIGERTLVTHDGRTSLDETAYETDASNIVWRVETSARLTGSVTNSVQIRRTRLTGLSDSLRSQTATEAADGRTTTVESSFNPTSSVLSTTSATASETPVSSTAKFGIPLSESSVDGVVAFAYDALGRSYAAAWMDDTGTTNRTETYERDASGNVTGRVIDYGGGRAGSWTSLFDMLGREITRMDPLGHVVTNAFDSLDRPVATDWDVYPLRLGHDTTGRKTLSATTRNGGASWDETRWEFDPASGVNTAKEYADGSRISYAHTDLGQKTRTTWARGAWKEHAYNARNLVSGTTYSGTATPSVEYTYADSGKTASAALSDGTAYSYAYDDRLLCTNETVTVAEDECAILRTYDAFRRPLNTAVVVTNIRHSAATRLYDSENRVCGYALTNAAGRGVAVSFDYNGSYFTNALYSLPDGGTFTVSLTRDPGRRELVTRRDYAFNGQPSYWYEADYDILGRPTNATDSASLSRSWTYNRRSELAAATIGTALFGYAFDTIGNREHASAGTITNAYSANSLNQYTAISNLCGSVPLRELQYDADGNLREDGALHYSYDAENRLVSARHSSLTNGALRVLNAYDHKHRRTRKTVQRFHIPSVAPPTPPPDGEWITTETHTYVWDGNNIVLERVAFTNGTIQTCEYFWGPDLSGTEQGAGGVGGLLAVSIDGAYHLPCYDHNGNIMRYIAEDGTTSAAYAYDPFGNIIESSGPLAEVFTFGFSTKPLDRETGLVSYQRRFHSPPLGRFLNRDPIEEEGGENLYALAYNEPVWHFDSIGLKFGSCELNCGYDNTIVDPYCNWMTGDMPITRSPIVTYSPNVDDGLSYYEGGMTYFYGNGSDVIIPIDQLGLSTDVTDYFDPCVKRDGKVDKTVDVFRFGNWSRGGPGRIRVHVEGNLVFDGKCWNYCGFLTAEDNDFDFDPRRRNERDGNSLIPWKECVTRAINSAGNVFPTKQFKMVFKGALQIRGKGKCK